VGNGAQGPALRRNYRIEWLLPEDASAIARIERRLYARGERLGRRHIFEDLTEAEADGGNLSIGLYLGTRLVGYIIAYREEDRTKPRTYLGIDVPHADAHGPAILFVDIAILPAHRLALPRLTNRFRENVACRHDLRDLPMDAFATARYASHWSDHPQFLTRSGWRLVQSLPFRDEQRQRQMFWLTFARLPAPEPAQSAEARTNAGRVGMPSADRPEIAVIRTEAEWASLESSWDALLRQTPDCTVFQTYSYLRTWWQFLGWKGELCIVVARRGGVPVAIAPLQLSYSRWLGRDMRCLGFIGQPSEIDRPTVLAAPEENEAVAAIAAYLAERRDLWDCVVLQEQMQGSPFASGLAECLQRARFNVSIVSGQDCLFTAVAGSWNAYLSGKSRSFRKSLKRKHAQLEERGSLTFEGGTPADPDQALERYLEVEDASWKASAGQGAGKTSAHRAFNRALLRGAVPGAQPQCSFLRVNDETIAATFGLVFARRFYSLHIAHDASWNDFSPGVVLTSMELEQAFKDRHYDVFDFLGGFPTNKRSWATGALTTFVLYADPPGLRGWLFHWAYFTAKPRLRNLLIRTRLLDVLKDAKQRLSERLKGATHRRTSE
jgi:CelD/BcsL family acetyltransferase involved in cellulose biosynthesis